LDDRNLISQCLAGKEKAQKLLYESYVNQMYRLCLRYLGNIEDAEDIMITAFHKVFKNIQNFEYRGSGSLGKWIKTIMINESLMFLRSSRKHLFESIDSSHVSILYENESPIDAEQIFQLIRINSGLICLLGKISV